MVTMDNISSSGSWSFIVPIIGATFLLDFCPFLLEVIGASKSSLQLFKPILKLAWELFPQDVLTCIPPIMSLYRGE
jgi:hypothetical protein